ncbi:hypothetical protein [Streptomyces sp. 1222.5]
MLTSVRKATARIPRKLRLPLAGAVALTVAATGLTLALPDEGGHLTAA